jgi:thiamine-phosphate pyrophosphorylase
MRRHHKNYTKKTALPKIWLMTDPRFGDDLLGAVQRLPHGSGVIVRHYDLPEKERLCLFKQLAVICRRRGHHIVLAGNEAMARRWKADGFHGRGMRKKSKRMAHTAAVHTLREIASAKRNEADLMLLSPVFTTASHPDARVLGAYQFWRLAQLCGSKHVVALGGMSKRKAMMFNKNDRKQQLIHGWAAIDAFVSKR